MSERRIAGCSKQHDMGNTLVHCPSKYFGLASRCTGCQIKTHLQVLTLCANNLWSDTGRFAMETNFVALLVFYGEAVLPTLRFNSVRAPFDHFVTYQAARAEPACSTSD